MYNFVALCDAFATSLSLYHETLFKLRHPAAQMRGGLSVENNSLSISRDRVVYDTLSGHDHITAKTLEQKFCEDFTALQTAVKDIPVIPEIFREIIVFGNPGSFMPGWAIYLETAAVCPSGQEAVKQQSEGLHTQLTVLGEKLQAAYTTSQSWGNTQEFLVANVINGKPTLPYRAVNTPSQSAALEADGWVWWQTYPQIERMIVEA